MTTGGWLPVSTVWLLMLSSQFSAYDMWTAEYLRGLVPTHKATTV